jgi:nucleoside-diphosphate-sugar epimerase
LLDVFAPLPDAGRSAAVFHRLRPTAAARSRDSSIHPADLRRPTDRSVWRWHTQRDYTYIDDIIQGTIAALNYDGRMYDVFNLGESQTIQLKDLISAIEIRSAKKRKINQLQSRPGDMPLTYADISKARKLLAYNPTTKLSEGLPRFIDWFLRNQRATRTQ